MKKTILINIIIIFSFFIIFELFLRAFNLSSLRGMTDSYFDNNINIEGKAFGVKFYTDQYGFRVPRKNYKYNKKNKNIILIGDSFVFGPGIKEEETFAGKFRKEMRNLNVFNSSRPGYNLNDYYNEIKFFLGNSNNNKFIIFLNFDDFKSLQIEETKKEKNSVQNIRTIPGLSKINNFFRSKLYSYVWLVGVITDPEKRYYIDSLENFNEDFAKSKILEIKNFVDNNENITFLITPYSYQIRNKCKQTNFILQNKIKNILLNNKINFYDFTKTFCNKSLNNNLFINFDPTHLSIYGHEIIFNFLEKKFN